MNPKCLHKDDIVNELHKIILQPNDESLPPIPVYFTLMDCIKNTGEDAIIFGQYEYRFSTYLKISEDMYIESDSFFSPIEHKRLNSLIADKIERETEVNPNDV